MPTKTGAMRYAHLPSWRAEERVPLTKDMVVRVVKRYPPGRAWKDAKSRITATWGDYSYYALFRSNGEVWLELRYSWASHCYECPPILAERLKRIRSFINTL